ncbi:flagellar motor switch protein FliG [Clostridium sp.]|uniref:flagellar motor switch protein FliG n=1 Tax=Clostridium sp. TaxID=1506 RepID=UPI001B3DCF86|nr:flagellar motor switch protein FliG [Clostridium sp.]MBP3917377.1 flagellar motor switch protein FliG [Clostridium sp.]
MSKDTEKIKGITKAALLMIALGQEAASGILKKMPEYEVQKITHEISNIPSVTGSERENVLNEFMELNKAHDYILEGGIEYAKNLLAKAFGLTKANEIVNKIKESGEGNRPFAIARKADASQIFNAIAYEHPQTIALVLCYLQQEKAAQILSELPEKIQTDVAFRIATLSDTSPIVIQEIEKVLESKLSTIVETKMTNLGGVNSLVEILNQVDRNTEKNITESLEKEDEELAEKIRSSMFVFEDIVTLDNSSIQRVLREVDNKELALALKGCSEQVMDAILNNKSKNAAQALREEIEYLGPVRLAEVEKAQQGIVSIIRKLDESQEIIINRGGSDAIVM